MMLDFVAPCSWELLYATLTPLLNPVGAPRSSFDCFEPLTLAKMCQWGILPELQLKGEWFTIEY